MFRDFAQFDGAGTPFEWTEAIGFGRQPFASFAAGPVECTAGPNGVAIGAFGWIDPDSGQVSNSFIPGAFLGFVLPIPNRYNQWERVFVQPGLAFPQMIIRPGIACVMAVAGTFQAKFPQGGLAGSRVYADPNTGLPYAILGPPLTPVSMDDAQITMDDTAVTMDQPNLVPTQWTLCQNGSPGTRLRMSSLVQPFTS